MVEGWPWQMVEEIHSNRGYGQLLSTRGNMAEPFVDVVDAAMQRGACLLIAPPRMDNAAVVAWVTSRIPGAYQIKLPEPAALGDDERDWHTFLFDEIAKIRTMYGRKAAVLIVIDDVEKQYSAGPNLERLASTLNYVLPESEKRVMAAVITSRQKTVSDFTKLLIGEIGWS